MMELKDIESRFGLSEHQARRLLRALAPVLSGRVRRGRDNRLILDDGALAIIERAVELWQAGLPLRDLSQSIAGEIKDSASPRPNGREPDQTKPSPDHCPLCQSREELIRELKADKERLIKLLEELHARIPALPAPPSLSRWQALKVALLGRA